MNKFLSILLVLLVISAIGILIYVAVRPANNEEFTEFYVLGRNGKAQNYPTEFTMTNSKVTGVRYDGISDSTNRWGDVTLGLVNHEGQETTYSIKMLIDNEAVDVNYDGVNVNQLGPIELLEDQTWQNEIGFSPEHVGDNQEVDFLLFAGNNPAPENILRLWINVQ